MALVRAGMDLALVQQWLGHAQLETTLIYARADTEMERRELAKAISDDSPLKPFLNSDRYKVGDEEMLKRLVGLR